MFAWMIVILVMAASAGPARPAHTTPIAVGRGVVLTPLSSWSSAAGDWDVGANAVVLKRAGAYVAFAAESFTGTKEELLAEQLKDLKQSFDSYRELPATATTMAGGLPALRVFATGSSDSSQQECELVVATSAGTGVIMEAIAAAGQLSVVQSDLSEMLQTLEVPR